MSVCTSKQQHVYEGVMYDKGGIVLGAYSFPRFHSNLIEHLCTNQCCLKRTLQFQHVKAM